MLSLFKKIEKSRMLVMLASLLFGLALAVVYCIIPPDIAARICLIRGIIVLLCLSWWLVYLVKHNTIVRPAIKNFSIFSVSLLWLGYIMYVIFNMEAINYPSSNAVFGWETFFAVLSLYLWSKESGER